MKQHKRQKKGDVGLESGMVPYARYQVEWRQAVPRKGSAFERMAVYAVDRLKDSELAGDSLRIVFVNILKVPDDVVDSFLNPALRDLLEHGTGALRREQDGRAPEDSPIRSFVLTDVGRELLSPTFHVRGQNPSKRWGFARRSSLHNRFRRFGGFA